MGTTKDKLARVSGARIDLVGPELVIVGPKDAVERATRYVRILLDQRHGSVTIKPDEHKGDLTLVQVPTACKGFITGNKGGTLRQIEKKHATLMTFCQRNDGDDEPLAIFGTKRGRLGAQLEVMSIVEFKRKGHYSKGSEFPIVDTLDEPDENWGVSFERLPKDMLGFVLGAKGATRQKLEISSGCIIQYIGDYVSFGGTKTDQKRGRDYYHWLLDTRSDNNAYQVPDLKDRDDYRIIWVPEPSVSYVTGVKANTLRKIEKASGTFCFFEKKRRPMEKMLIFSHIKKNRDIAVDEVKKIVSFHQKKQGDQSGW
eukprot:UN31244